MNLAPVGCDRRQVRLQMQFEADHLWERGLQHFFQLAHERVEVERRKARFCLPRGSQQLLHERGAAFDRFLDHLDRAGDVFGFCAETFEPVGVAQNDGENVVEIVRDSSRQRAEAFHFLRLHQLLLEALSFRVVKKVNLKLGQLAVAESPNNARHHIDRIAIALPHLELMPVDDSLLPHDLE